MSIKLSWKHSNLSVKTLLPITVNFDQRKNSMLVNKGWRFFSLSFQENCLFCKDNLFYFISCLTTNQIRFTQPFGFVPSLRFVWIWLLAETTVLYSLSLSLFVSLSLYLIRNCKHSNKVTICSFRIPYSFLTVCPLPSTQFHPNQFFAKKSIQQRRTNLYESINRLTNDNLYTCKLQEIICTFCL